MNLIHALVHQVLNLGGAFNLPISHGLLFTTFQLDSSHRIVVLMFMPRSYKKNTQT